MITTCYMPQVPEEITFAIFSQLRKRALAKCAAVCKTWYNRSAVNELWVKFFPGIPYTPKGTELKQQYVASVCSAYAKSDLQKHFRNFINGMKAHQIGIFKCLFPFNPGQSLEIKIQFQEESIWSQRVEKACCFNQQLSNYSYNIIDFSREDSKVLSYHASTTRWARKFFTSVELLVIQKSSELRDREAFILNCAIGVLTASLAAMYLYSGA